MRTLAVLVATCLLARSVAAQDTPEARPHDDDSLGTMTAEQLEAEGWEHRGAGVQSGSAVGGLLALTIGAVVHGFGHLYLEDERTGRSLLIAEGVSLGLIGLGVLLDTLTNSAGELAPAYRGLTAIGGGLFVATWLLDVIGTFKGTSGGLPEHSDRLADIRIAALYTHLFDVGVPLLNVTSIRVDADLGAFFVYPHLDAGIDRGYWSFGASAGVRFGIGRRPLSYLDLSLYADETIFSDDGFAYESLGGSVGLSVDLGDAFAHLDGIVYRNRVGVGAQLFRFDFNDGAPLSGDTVVSLLLVETSLSGNPFDTVNIELGYAQRPDTLVGNLNQSVGAFFGTFTWAFAPPLDIFVDARLGKGTALIVGTSFHWWPWPRSDE